MAAGRLADHGGRRVDRGRTPGHDEGNYPTHPAQEPAMPFSHLPALLSSWFALLVTALDHRSAPRLALLLCGALFARGRRTVTSWFRAAGITDAFRPAYSALW